MELRAVEGGGLPAGAAVPCAERGKHQIHMAYR